MQVRKRQIRRGVVVIEFALCGPVLVLAMFATIEFCRVTQLQHAARQAAFEGARAGLTLDSTTNSVQTAATSALAALGITNSTITISPNPLAYTTPTVSVTVTVNGSSNGWYTHFFTSASGISATIVLDREVQAISNP